VSTDKVKEGFKINISSFLARVYFTEINADDSKSNWLKLIVTEQIKQGII